MKTPLVSLLTFLLVMLSLQAEQTRYRVIYVFCAARTIDNARAMGWATRYEESQKHYTQALETVSGVITPLATLELPVNNLVAGAMAGPGDDYERLVWLETSAHQIQLLARQHPEAVAIVFMSGWDDHYIYNAPTSAVAKEFYAEMKGRGLPVFLVAGLDRPSLRKHRFEMELASGSGGGVVDPEGLAVVLEKARRAKASMPAYNPAPTPRPELPALPPPAPGGTPVPLRSNEIKLLR